jgi:hypothetical protein
MEQHVWLDPGKTEGAAGQRLGWPARVYHVGGVVQAGEEGKAMWHPAQCPAPPCLLAVKNWYLGITPGGLLAWFMMTVAMHCMHRGLCVMYIGWSADSIPRPSVQYTSNALQSL